MKEVTQFKQHGAKAVAVPSFNEMRCIQANMITPRRWALINRSKYSAENKSPVYSRWIVALMRGVSAEPGVLMTAMAIRSGGL